MTVTTYYMTKMFSNNKHKQHTPEIMHMWHQHTVLFPDTIQSAH